MPLSANTLLHFTKKKANLKNILEENFRIFFCEENLALSDEQLYFSVPMVSFCDIPLSEIKNHIKRYGNYGLGMTKEWGVKQGLNPILYISQTSNLANSYRHVFETFVKMSISEFESWDDKQKAVADILRHMKNYESSIKPDGTPCASNRYSDEREWRYVPPYNEMYGMLVTHKGYSVFKNKFDQYVSDMRLEFEPNDIKYIIIKDDSEIQELTDHLKAVKGSKYSHDDIDRLTTRILTTEQIKTDI